MTPSDEARKAKYEWLLDTFEQQRALSPQASRIPRCRDLTGEQFLDLFYAPARPVVLTGEIDDWPARSRWTPAYLREKLGEAPVEYQGGRASKSDFERDKAQLRYRVPFTEFIDFITAHEGNDVYLTAYNSDFNAAALRPLQDDIRPLDNYLSQSPHDLGGMLWIGPRGTFTPMHHDLTNNLFVQVVGRKRFVMASAAELAKLYNDSHVFSAVQNVASPDVDLAAYPLLKGVHFYEVTLQPGDILFIPIGWWHQVTAMDFSISLTYTNFRWRNDFHLAYPV